MRPSPDPANLTYIAFRKKRRHSYVYKEFAPWPLKKSCKSCESVSIIAGRHPSEAPTEDITVLVERTPRAESISAQFWTLQSLNPDLRI